ncbi:MAG TPA: YciI family protein [Gammaproteobacteria bacterium]|jgi:hypothetical protein
MQYLLLIYANESKFRSMGSAELEAMSKEYGVYTQAIVKSGHLKGGERLRPTADAQTVRVKDGKVVSTDGPFAETREQLAGFYLVEAKDMDEAKGLAVRIPGAKVGCIEVRPIWPVTME